MSVVKFNPFIQGRTFSNLIDDVFTRSISDMVGGDYANTTPSVNITETNDHYTIEVAAPGLEKNDFHIGLEKDQLTISASKETNKEEGNDGQWTRKEFNFGSFKRTFHITDAVESEKIEAEYKNGILTLVLPKKEEVKAKPPMTIEIK